MIIVKARISSEEQESFNIIDVLEFLFAIVKCKIY